MGCSLLCRVNKENEIIKSKINQDFIKNNEPIIENIEKTETQKEITKDKKLKKMTNQSQLYYQ